MFVYVGAITAAYNEPQPPLYLRPEPLPREGNMGEDRVGITVLDLDMASGALTQIQTVRGLRNPTFLAMHPTLPLLYAAERGVVASRLRRLRASECGDPFTGR